MEGNSAVLECLIYFYINVKHILKTKQLVERVFMEQMIKHSKESGFNNYTDEEIKVMWKSMVTKYIHLKNKGTSEDKESWKYFEILDCCYEQSDFYSGMHPKFSEDMVWFLIECFLKRKTLMKSQKLNRIISEIHKDFLHYGYLYITRQDIDNKWKALNMKYDKLKGDPASFKKLPYLEALKAFHEESGKSVVKMVFTRELTEILVERFTEKKITCVIHGYDSDQVLSEIQFEFMDLGFYFSKEDIKEKWKTLTNIYKFLIAKGKKECSWIYFNSMKNHFKNDFLFPINKMDIKNKRISKQRRLRGRSKSVGAELKKDTVKPTLVVKLNNEKLSPTPKTKLEREKICTRKNKSVKRATDNHRKGNSRKKLNKAIREADISVQENVDTCQTENCNYENKDSGMSHCQPKDKISLIKNIQLNKFSIDQNQDRRNSTDMSSPTSKVHIINIDHSDIDRKSGNLTINLPSITKQFSENEFLPLKKRIRLENKSIHSDMSKDMEDGFRGFPSSEVAGTEKNLTGTSENKRLTEEEMEEIMERINREDSKNFETNKGDLDNITNYFSSGEFNYQNVYNNFNQQCLIVPKEEHQDDAAAENYTNPNTIAQPPVLLLVIKVDGSNNPLRDSTSNEANLKLNEFNNRSVTNKESGESGTKSGLSNKQERSSEISNVSSTTVKIVSPKGKTIIQDVKKKSEISDSDLGVTYSETKIVHNSSSEIISDSVNSTSSLIASDNTHLDSGFILSENEQLCNSEIYDNDSVDMDHLEVCSIGENVTVYTTEENQIEPSNTANKTYEPQRPEDVFREPFAVPEKSHLPKIKISNKTLSTVEGNTTLPAVKRNTGSVRLPVKVGGKLKEIFISPREFRKLPKFKPENFRTKNNILKKSDSNTSQQAVSTTSKAGIKFMSQIIKPARSEIVKGDDEVTNQPVDVTSTVPALPVQINSSVPVTSNFSHSKNGKNEEFENESVLSEAVGDDEGLKNNLLATVIDFQEQNNQEFIEIKNLMKQNNLLQRETNRLLRLMLEKQ